MGGGGEEGSLNGIQVLHALKHPICTFILLTFSNSNPGCRDSVLGLLLPQLIKCQTLLDDQAALALTCMRLFSIPPHLIQSEDALQVGAHCCGRGDVESKAHP